MRVINTNRIYVFSALTTNSIIFQANPRRKAFIIYNNGANIVEFLDNPNGLYGSGFPVKPTGVLSDDHFNPQGELYVIATGGTTELRVWEVISQERR